MSDTESDYIPYKQLPPTEQWFYERLTLGLPSALRRVSGVHKVEIQRRAGCEEKEIENWESTNDCKLPSDLRDFYKSTDGFNLRWGYSMQDSVAPIGRLSINNLSKLKPLYHDNMLALSPLIPHEHPRFDRISDKIFVLEFTKDGCYVCLVYMAHKDEYSIWLLDRSFEWHFLSTTFTKYFRVMLVHQGLPQWQLTLTPLGMAPWAEQLAYSLSQNVVCKKGKIKRDGSPVDTKNVTAELQALAQAEARLMPNGEHGNNNDIQISYDEDCDDDSLVSVMSDISQECTDFESNDTPCESACESDFHLMCSDEESVKEGKDDDYAPLSLNEDELSIDKVSTEEFNLDTKIESKDDFMKILQCISKLTGTQTQSHSSEDIFYEP